MSQAPVSGYAFGPFLFDAARGTLTREGAAVPMGARALALLHALLDANGAIVDKDTLIRVGWPGLVVEESNLSVQIAALRKALGAAPDGGDWVVTVPRHGYRLPSSVAVKAADAQAGGDAHRPTAPSTRPSIAVLPFKNLSADPSQEYFVDGITDDVIAALTRFRWFRVAGRSPSFAFKAAQVDARQAGAELGVRYVVQGSVRKAGERLRISVELVDATDGHCQWADRYDFDLVDVFTVQDRIAQRVAGSIEPELLQSETGSIAAGRGSGSLTAWDLVAQGCWNFHQITQPTHQRAREFFRQARRVDPLLAESRIWLARVDAGVLAFGWADDVDEVKREGMDAALEGVRMDEKNCYAHYGLAIMSVMCEAFDAAIRAAERAVDLSPSFALGHLVLGMAKLYSGDAAGAIAPLEQGLELNRHDPHNFIWYNHLALARLFSGDPAQAMEPASMSLTVRPRWRAAMETMAACCGALGRSDEARHWRAQAASLEAPAGDALQPLWRGNPGWAKAMRDLLAR